MPMANKKSNVVEERRIQLENFLNELSKVNTAEIRLFLFTKWRQNKDIVQGETLQKFLELQEAIDRELSNNKSRR